MRRLVLTYALLVAPLAAAAAPPAGVYSSVREDPATGEWNGVELSLRDSGWGEFVLCEGSCKRGLTGPLNQERDRVSFTVHETYVDRRTFREFRPSYRYEGRISGEAILLEWSDRPGFTPQILERIPASPLEAARRQAEAGLQP